MDTPRRPHSLCSTLIDAVIRVFLVGRKGRIFFEILVILFAGCLLGIPPRASAATASSLDTHIPTTFQMPIPWDSRPSPVCSQCKAVSQKVVDSSDGSTTGVDISFTFQPEDGAPYVGELCIEMRTFQGEKLEVYTDFVTIADGQTLVIELDDEQGYWNFEEVEAVTIRLLTSQPAA